jgi:hypothetical protein
VERKIEENERDIVREDRRAREIVRAEAGRGRSCELREREILRADERRSSRE